MLLSTVCVNSLGCLIFSYYLPALWVCIHSRLYPICICVNSACVDPACLCCLCWPCWLVSLRPLSVFRRCLCQLCLCALFVSMWTRCVCAHSVFLHSLWLSAHSYVLVTRSVFAHPLVVHQSLPTLLLSFCSLGCPFCLAVLFMSLFLLPTLWLVTHFVFAHSLISDSLFFCPLDFTLKLMNLVLCQACRCILEFMHLSKSSLGSWIFILWIPLLWKNEIWPISDEKSFKPHSAPWRQSTCFLFLTG